MNNDSIDALFGSKTRVKLLNLFLNNPGKAFYVREITRLIDEQVNSVRRELSNMQNVGVVKSSTKDRKLFYSVNSRYKHYTSLRSMFAGINPEEQIIEGGKIEKDWQKQVKKIKQFVKVFVISGVLVDGSESNTDMLLVGDNNNNELSNWASMIEKNEGRDLNYSIMTFEEFYYRMSIRDRFITDIIDGKHRVIVDTGKILKDE